MATVTMNTDAAPVVVYTYCFEGRWDENDTIHNCPSLCGQITYIDAFGNTQTESGITSQMGVITIEAQSIISTVGVDAATCPQPE